VLRFTTGLLITLEDGHEVTLPGPVEVENLKDLNELILRAVYRKRKETEPTVSRAGTIAAWDCGFADNSSVFKRNL
jgi:hypothetical protein